MNLAQQPEAPTASKARPVRKRWIAPGGIRHRGILTARVLGDRGVPVVLLHGIAGSSNFWGAAYDSLADRARLVAPDLLGFGDSPWPASGYGPDEHADAVVACLQEIGIQVPAIVVGHSLGALIALRIAVRYPDRVRSVVGLAPPIYRNRSEAKSRMSGYGLMERLFSSESRFAKAICMWMCAHRPAAAKIAVWLRPDLPPAIARDAVRHTWTSYSETYRRVLAAAEGASWLPDLTVPLVLVAGDRDNLVDLDFLKELTDRFPLVSVRVRKGAGHDLPIAFPDYCLEAISSMLDAASVSDPNHERSPALAPRQP